MSAVVLSAPKPEPCLCIDIEVAVARYFNYRSHLIVPNVFWGLGFKHELDVLVLSDSGYITEVEIKTNAADIRRDIKKSHGHRSNRIARHFVAVPKQLVDLALSTFPEFWGVIGVSGGFAETLRMAKINKSVPLTAKEINHCYKLAAMRVWTLKEALRNKIARDRLHSKGSVE